MPDKPVPTMRELIVVDDPDTVKLLFSGRYGDILELIDTREMSVSDIAKILDINPGSAHYHLKELEKRGLVEMVREETKGNMVKKYYRAVAHTISIDTSRFKIIRPGDIDPMESLSERIFKLLPAFGIEFPDDKEDDLKSIVIRYYRRVKELQRRLQDSSIEKTESDRMLISDAYAVALMLAETEDEEMGNIREELRAILLEARGRR